jgi:hypothetical protein
MARLPAYADHTTLYLAAILSLCWFNQRQPNQLRLTAQAPDQTTSLREGLSVPRDIANKAVDS